MDGEVEMNYIAKAILKLSFITLAALFALLCKPPTIYNPYTEGSVLSAWLEWTSIDTKIASGDEMKPTTWLPDSLN